jgi:peroxiredoxin
MMAFDAFTLGGPMNPTALMPRQTVPPLDLPLTTGGRYVSGDASGERFDLLVFYRGLHCPICAKYLLELERLGEEFKKRGVRIVAISSDESSRAQEMAEKVHARHIEVAYGLDLAMARRWGLYISASKGKTSIGLDEPALFSEPGVFLVTPEQTLYYGSTQTMPFARPSFSDLLAAVDFAIQKNYPARGEFEGEL